MIITSVEFTKSKISGIISLLERMGVSTEYPESQIIKNINEQMESFNLTREDVMTHPFWRNLLPNGYTIHPKSKRVYKV